MAIRIRSLGQDLACFISVGGSLQTWVTRTRQMIPKVIQKKTKHDYTLFTSRKFKKGAKDIFIQGSKSVTLKKQRLLMRMRNSCQFKDSPHRVPPKKEKVPWSKVSIVLCGLEKLYTPFLLYYSHSAVRT